MQYLLNMGKCYEGMNQDEDALGIYEEVLSKSSDFPEALEGAERIRRKLGLKSKAEQERMAKEEAQRAEEARMAEEPQIKEEGRMLEDVMAEPQQGSLSIADELKKLAELRDKGVISEEDFLEFKKKLLSK